MARVALLGSTGSIGRQTLEVLRQFRSRFEVLALAAGSNVELLSRQVREFRPAIVSLRTKEGAQQLSRLLGRGERPLIVWGREGLLQIATLPEAELVVNGLVGAIGLEPTLAALQTGKRVCLANKESLVIGGHLVQCALRSNGELIPIDSEHSAIFQLLEGRPRKEARRIILTASGGAVRDRPLRELLHVTPEEVLQHPNWRMGPRVTVDSATLVNKSFEVIEAHWLFGLDYSRIEALLHPQSVVHGLVAFADGTLAASLSPPDMRLSIQYALTYPERLETSFPELNLAGLRLDFAPIDPCRYPAFETVVQAGQIGGSLPAALNGADEVLVARFLNGEISFTTIAAGLRAVLDEHRVVPAPDLEETLEADRWGRRFAEGIC